MKTVNSIEYCSQKTAFLFVCFICWAEKQRQGKRLIVYENDRDFPVILMSGEANNGRF